MDHRSLLPHLSGIAIVLLVATLADDSLTRRAVAEQYICTAVRDNTIFQGDPSNSNGAGTWFAAGKNGTDIQRGLIQFDLSQIPVGSIVDSATLSLYVTDAPKKDYTATRYFWLQALEDVGTPSWGEGSSDAGDVGQGADALSGDATWLLKQFDPDYSWPGGDGALGPGPIIYPDTSLAAGCVPGNANIPLQVQWTKSALTDQMIIDIQAWVDDPTTNDGWVVLGEEDSAASHTKRQFASRDIVSPVGFDYRPTLTVNTAPEPSSWLLSFIAAAMSAGYAWRTRRRPTACTG